MQKLAKREEQIMQACWHLGKAFIKEIIAELPDPKPHYNSVATMVRILEEKGFLGHETLGNTFQYYPVISKEQYQRLISYIERSLQTDASVNAITIGPNARYNDHDAFYEAKGSYNLFHTCNTWTNDALKVSGQKACWWTPYDKGILNLYR